MLFFVKKELNSGGRRELFPGLGFSAKSAAGEEEGGC